MTPFVLKTTSRVSRNRYVQIYLKIIDKLTVTNTNFKFIVNTILVARGGNGLDIGGLSFWNSDMDGSVCVKWEGKFITCIVTIYGIAN